MFYKVVERYSRCGVHCHWVANFLQSLLVKNCENWSIFSEDIDKVR